MIPNKNKPRKTNCSIEHRYDTNEPRKSKNRAIRKFIIHSSNQNQHRSKHRDLLFTQNCTVKMTEGGGSRESALRCCGEECELKRGGSRGFWRWRKHAAA